MDLVTMQNLAKLRRLAAGEGKPFDLVRFTTDLAYTEATLTHILDSDNLELLTVGLQVMQAVKPPRILSGDTAPRDDGQKNVGRLR